MKYWKIVRLLLPLFFTMGCDDKNDSVREEQQTLIIASVLPAQKESLVLVGGSSGEGVWNPLYICKNEDSADWRIWHTDFRIRGFDEIYEEGYEYRIRIRIRYWQADPAIAEHNPKLLKLSDEAMLDTAVIDFQGEKGFAAYPIGVSRRLSMYLS